ncbi:hypothetical protein NPIL_703951 [Nephila pilipes]|uniref:Secreted protein n=1 Tax=Nephila pilipes TaxID=299642 RepID=A0A8X6I6B3_NEPPI|nr:hypothetical protein NPIL_703951 [Nephila pilipes]
MATKWYGIVSCYALLCGVASGRFVRAAAAKLPVLCSSLAGKLQGGMLPAKVWHGSVAGHEGKTPEGCHRLDGESEWLVHKISETGGCHSKHQ